jgi:hypothetical protein
MKKIVEQLLKILLYLFTCILIMDLVLSFQYVNMSKNAITEIHENNLTSIKDKYGYYQPVKSIYSFKGICKYYALNGKLHSFKNDDGSYTPGLFDQNLIHRIEKYYKNGVNQHIIKNDNTIIYANYVSYSLLNNPKKLRDALLFNEYDMNTITNSIIDNGINVEVELPNIKDKDGYYMPTIFKDVDHTVLKYNCFDKNHYNLKSCKEHGIYKPTILYFNNYSNYPEYEYYSINEKDEFGNDIFLRIKIKYDKNGYVELIISTIYTNGMVEQAIFRNNTLTFTSEENYLTKKWKS